MDEIYLNEIKKLRNDIEELRGQINKGNFSTVRTVQQDLDIDHNSGLILNSNETETTRLKFKYDFVGTPTQRKTRFEIYQEENGGPLLIDCNVHTTRANSVSIGDDVIVLTGAGEIDLTAPETFATGLVYGKSGTATPAGGTKVFALGSAALGICFGSGAPTLSAPKGSLYLRTDGSGTGDRAYINTDAGTTWTAITTAA